MVGLTAPTDRAPAYPRVLDELVPSACHVVEQYANNPIEADHGRLKSRLRPMRGLKRRCSARVISAGHGLCSEPPTRTLRTRSRRRPTASGSGCPLPNSPAPSDHGTMAATSACTR
jgi:transposase-like protein